MQGKSLKEILVWMNNAAIDHLLIEGFYRPMKGAQMFVYSRNSLSKILDLVNIEDKYQDPNSIADKTMIGIQQQAEAFIDALQKHGSDQEKKVFLKRFVDNIYPSSTPEQLNLDAGSADSARDIIIVRLETCNKRFKASKGFYKSKLWGFMRIGPNMYGEPEGAAPSHLHLFISTYTQNETHVDLLIRKDALVA